MTTCDHLWRLNPNGWGVQCANCLVVDKSDVGAEVARQIVDSRRAS